MDSLPPTPPPPQLFIALIQQNIFIFCLNLFQWNHDLIFPMLVIKSKEIFASILKLVFFFLTHVRFC